jgi:serine/threonine protein phosphatase 1
LLHIDEDLASFPEQRAIQVFLGDYMDRGPDSRVVLERLIECGQTHEVVCLKKSFGSFHLVAPVATNSCGTFFEFRYF